MFVLLRVEFLPLEIDLLLLLHLLLAIFLELKHPLSSGSSTLPLDLGQVRFQLLLRDIAIIDLEVLLDVVEIDVLAWWVSCFFTWQRPCVLSHHLEGFGYVGG